ncbi:sulfite exporter TauE/SafE family protein, partial [Micromonospora endophytica]
MTALVLTLVGAVLIGVSLGLLGGGGSILAVPLLVYVADLPTREAIATSLLVVGATSAVGVLPHARAHRVRWRTGLVFGLAGMTGAYAGGRLAAYVPTAVLLTGFAVMMLATAFAMLRGQRDATADGKVPSRELPVRRVVLDGALVGLVTGLVGAGGGFLVVPALVLLGGLPMPVAIGTSLVVIAMKSVAGLAGYLATVSLDWGLAAAVTVAAVAGSLLGGRLVGRIPAALLRRAFGWFVVAMGVFVLGQQVPLQWRTAPLFWAVSGGLAAALAATVLIRATAERRPSVDSSEWDARYASAPDLVWTAEPNRFVVKETGGLTPG